ncbi:hypothetical protein J4Q44_G00231820 [Coregonus suidteri]|uniref:Uncharacterized protein n=1 Tax=Coregonus suidteri TaxID=861788 RepID=A0AAN8L6L2_9TELE
MDQTGTCVCSPGAKAQPLHCSDHPSLPDSNVPISTVLPPLPFISLHSSCLHSTPFSYPSLYIPLFFLYSTIFLSLCNVIRIS